MACRQFAFAALQTLFDLTQVVRTSQLAKEHRHQLRPTAYSTRMALGVQLAYFALRVRPRNKLENLTEQAAESVHVEPFCGAPERCGNRSSLHGKARRLSPNLDDSDSIHTGSITSRSLSVQSLARILHAWVLMQHLSFVALGAFLAITLAEVSAGYGVTSVS